MPDPWLSVIIPVYNGENYLAEALDSIVAQNDPSIECIAVDDDSQDRTLEILNSYTEKLNLIIIQKKKNIRSWVKNVNFGMSLAKGKYATILHQDDLWYPYKLNRIKSIIAEYPEIGFLISATTFINSEGKNIGELSYPLSTYPNIANSKEVFEKLLIQNFISLPSPIFKKDLFIRNNGLDEKFSYTGDWDLWIKISLDSNTIYYPFPLSKYRIHSNNLSYAYAQNINEYKRQHLDILRKYSVSINNPKLNKISRFSVELNSTLIQIVSSQNPNLLKLIIEFLRLGIISQYKYLYVSRIWQRSIPRIKAGFAKNLRQYKDVVNL